MPVPSYTLQQQSAVLSILVNSVSNHIGTARQLQARLAYEIASALLRPSITEYIGKWSVVWGPAVFKAPCTFEATNALMAARNLSSGDIVVAMAGTNPGSLFDAVVEDLQVGEIVPFAGAENAWISLGTSIGIEFLENLVDPTTGRTLFAFLNALPPTHANLIFTGHSLGGSLSPVLALDYALHHALHSGTFNDISVYPTAGPTPGNAAFASLFATTFPAIGTDPLHAWNQNVRNSLDVIPHAWADLPQLPSLYPQLNDGIPLPCVNALVDQALLPATHAHAYSDLPRVSFNAPFDAHATAPFPGVNAAYLAQLVHQHIAAYEDLLLPELKSEMPVLLTLSRLACVAFELWCGAVA